MTCHVRNIFIEEVPKAWIPHRNFTSDDFSQVLQQAESKEYFILNISVFYVWV